MKQKRITIAHVAQWRLHNQALARPRFETAADVVRWLGAVQAQDFAAAKWAIGQRMIDGTDGRIERAFDEGAILRTHVLRPTWHFVLPEDIRWLIALTAPRVHAVNAYVYRRFGLDAATRRRSNAIIERALRGRQYLARAAVVAKLRAARVASDPIAIGTLLMAAELDALICSGPLQGKRHTYALLEERVPPAPSITRDEAIARLTRRFFASHGPATARDFCWWSGLLAKDVRLGLELTRSALVSEVVEGEHYWRMPSTERPTPGRSRVHLLSNFDEYLVAYADRRAAYDVDCLAEKRPSRSPVFAHTVLIDGQIVATWQRSVARGAVAIVITPIRGLGRADRTAVRRVAERYAAFLGTSPQVTYGA